MEFDWQHRVDTTGGSVAWRERLLGVFHSAYQPTEPDLFREMMAALPIEFNQFTFIDLGSGKGRTLLMASDFPFRKILGAEILPALHHIAQENLRRYRSPSQQCSALEALCCDAAEFDFPAEPLLLYLFNPLPEAGLRRVMARLAQSWQAHPRPLFIMYHHAALEHILLGIQNLARVGGTEQFSLYAFAEESPFSARTARIETEVDERVPMVNLDAQNFTKIDARLRWPSGGWQPRR